MRRVLSHPLFGPGLALGALGWGAAVIAFLLVGPGLAPWADTLLRACFGWNAETRHYRLDGVLLALFQPPLFAAVVAFFYADDVRRFLGGRGGRAVGLAVSGLFLGLGGYLVTSNEVSASGVVRRAESLSAPIRGGTPAPSFALVDHRGQRVTDETFRGRPVVLSFVYANCHQACPVLIARLQALETGRPGDAAFVAVTLDPERDTPAALAHHAERWGLGSRWHLLSGEPAAVWRLVAGFGVEWAKLADGEIAHENVIVLLDRAGRVAFTYRGLAHPAARQAGDLARLVGERG